MDEAPEGVAGKGDLDAGFLYHLRGQLRKGRTGGQHSDPLAGVPKPSDWLSGAGLGGTAQLATLQTVPAQTCPCSQRDRQLLCKYLVLTPHALPPAAPTRPH